MGDLAEELYQANQEKMANEIPEFDPDKMPEFKMPTMEEFVKMLDTMDMTEDDKEQLKRDLANRNAGGGGIFGDRASSNMSNRFHMQSTDYIIFISMIAIIVLVFALFGYKLIRSLVDKQKKREEKQKAKQAKKKTKTN